VIQPRPAPTGEFLRSLAIQRRVIGALLMREVITRFGRHNLGVLWLIGEPMIFTLGVTALWVASGMNHGASLPIVAFAITGYSSVLMWRNSVGRCTSALQQNLNLMYHRNVQAIDVLLTRILLELGGATASFVVLSLFFGAIEMISPPADLWMVLFGWLMLGWFALGLALTVGALTAWSPLVERLWHPIAYLLFPLSGAAFMVDWLPPPGQQVVLLLPMVHGLEMLREGYFGAAVRTHYDVPYMAMWCLGVTLTGLFLTREAARRVEAE
jgi:capsular polysaccharide transport system permease protein